MVGGIYVIDMPYSHFRQFKARPVLVFKKIDKNDLLVLPLTTNLSGKGIVIDSSDIKEGSLKKKSVLIIPKLTAIDSGLINHTRCIAKLKSSVFAAIREALCAQLEC
ncbi:type II toxin-antitoxin system PemK/MazF family toxin [Sulfurovum sp.]|uniref:type II toxin-antitoxin system PemK/MazF family toxin n=1 Tax=Sulfurovum sp. TaxID=1969726 RepID=UPI0025DDE0A4|nr:type II toxin-antitoxin system PemK/MazF family toxin [Sulfurovum sp.]